MKTNLDLGLCICTYKRPRLLKLLLEDCARQSTNPSNVYIIDGDSSSNDVLDMLYFQKWPNTWHVHYLKSNHGNQTYQRYLGYRLASTDGMRILLFLDDDLRIHDERSIENMVKPFYSEENHAVAITGNLIFPEKKSDNKEVTLDDFRKGLGSGSFFINFLGESRRYPPGSLTPSGKRVMYGEDSEHYHQVEWLRGGAIAFDMSYLSEKILSEDIFAMNHLRMGLCEDLVISRKMLAYGNLYVAEEGVFLHPNDDSPKAYSSKAYNFGFASAYSRRWLNDNYRGFNKPKFSDRVSLIRQYIVSSFLSLFAAIRYLRSERFSFAFGYIAGAIMGLIRTPTAKNLTPEIDWWKDAEEALSKAIVIK